VQQILGLVLEAQHANRRALAHVGQRHPWQARADADRVSVRARGRVADRRKHALLEHRRHRVLEPLRLLVHLIPGDAEHVGQEALDQAVAANDLLGLALAARGERDHLVGAARDVVVALEAADHLVHRRRRQLHRAGDVGAGHRQAGLVQPVEGLEVPALGVGEIGDGHQR
jgi:hypothetical protein